MSMKIKIIVTFILLFALPIIGLTQTSTINGRIVDANNVPVSGANVYLIGTVLGASSDDQGIFHIGKVPAGAFQLMISVIGYEQKKLALQIKAGQQINIGVITLSDMAFNSEPILVTASRYEQNIQDIPVSVDMISRQEMQSRNTVSIDKALQYVPGLNLNQSQLNIRGSTGYSKGVGSRVIMLVDGMPYLTGDTQDLIFSAIQINQIERIEIVKGAGSALYGSSAMGGVVNVITKDISEEPQATLKFYGGFYSDPYYPQWRWNKDNKYMNGMSFDYSARSGFIGYNLAASTDQDDSHKQNDWFKRYQAGGKLQFTLSPYRRLVIGGNYMTQKRGDFLYWKDLAHALIPPAGQLDDIVKSTRYHLSADFRQILDNRKFYSLKTIWFKNHFEDNIEGAQGQQGNNSTSDFLNTEFQYTWQRPNQHWIGGISLTLNSVESNLFGNQGGKGAAFFIQDEIKWNDKISSTLGLRFDYFDLDSIGVNNQLNPKLGIVYKIWEGAALRTSLGSSYRAPSIAEAFTSTSAGGLKVIPNLNLDPEKSWSYELGLNQFLGQNLFFDLAFFYTRVWDLIEGKFVESGNVQFINITDARIMGGEVVLNWEIVKDLFSWRLGYTYSDPWNLSQEKYLTYRPRHLFYQHAVFNYRNLQLNMDYRLISRYDQIDESFSLIISDAEERVTAHVVDLRLSLHFPVKGVNLETSLQVNNAFQYNYVDVVGSIAPIRHVIWTLAAAF